MPLFFVLAGLQVDRSISKGRAPFLTNKLRTIAYPYILWSLFQGTVQLLSHGFLNSPRSPWSLATILWRPIAQFWFLYVLFLCHLLAFVTRARRPLLILMIIGSFVCAPLIANGVPDAWMVPAALTHWFVFYALGILLSRFVLGWKPRTTILISSTAVAAVTFASFSHFGRILSRSNPDTPASWPASIAGIVLVICLSHLLLETRAWLATWGGVLGRASLTIYIFHVLAAAGMRIELDKLQVMQWPVQLVLGTVVGVGAPLLLHLLLERSNLLAPLGLGAPAKTQSTRRVITN